MLHRTGSANATAHYTNKPACIGEKGGMHGKPHEWTKMNKYPVCNILVVDIPLLLQLNPLIAQRSYHLFIFSSPHNIRFQDVYQCLFVSIQPMGRRHQCSFSFFRNFQRQTSFPEQLINALLNQRYIHRYGRSDIPTKRGTLSCKAFFGAPSVGALRIQSGPLVGL